jgi:iron-sulfur cluster insertion protein
MIGQQQTTPLTVLPAASNKIWQLISEEDNRQLKLRVYVTGGGCSGLQYGFTFTEDQQPEDIVISAAVDEKHMIQVLVDSLSLQYLQGAEIDYKNDLSGEQFIIRNPNATTSCSCGASFATDN